MHPILFEIPGLNFPVRSFGVAIVIAFLTGIWVWKRLLARYGDNPAQDVERAWDVATWMLIGAIGGARIVYVIVELSKYWAWKGDPMAREVAVGRGFAEAPWEILYLWNGGLVMYGGFFGAVLLGVRAARKAGYRAIHALDLGLIGGFVGQGIGRWGCLLVGDDYGSVVPAKWEHLPFPITERVPSLEWLQANPASLFEHELAGKLLWATQIWESANAFLVALLGYWVLRHRRYAGQVSAVIFGAYSVNRFLVELARGDALRGVWFGGALSTSQLISVPVVLASAFLLWKNRAKTDPVRR